MELRSITGLSPEDAIAYENIYTRLLNRFPKIEKYTSLASARAAALTETNTTSGYAHNLHTGKIKEGVELTPLELSMLVDGGYSHFGGQSQINADGHYYVKIYTD